MPLNTPRVIPGRASVPRRTHSSSWIPAMANKHTPAECLVSPAQQQALRRPPVPGLIMYVPALDSTRQTWLQSAQSALVVHGTARTYAHRPPPPARTTYLQSGSEVAVVCFPLAAPPSPRRPRSLAAWCSEFPRPCRARRLLIGDPLIALVSAASSGDPRGLSHWPHAARVESRMGNP